MHTTLSNAFAAVPASLRGRDALVDDAARRARGYLAGLAERPVSPPSQAVSRLEELAMLPLTDEPRDAAEVLALLDEIGSPATVATAGPRYFGFVNGGTLPVSLAASWLLAAWDQNVALSVMSPTCARLEEIALDWIIELLGLPRGAGGGFVAGATAASTVCLAVARDHVLQRAGWDAARDGLVGAPPIQVVVGEQVHAGVLKALGMVGLGRDRALRLPCDAQGRIRADRLPRLTGPAIVCLQAGNVNGGASDPFPDLIGWAHEGGAWVHVDGAFGLWAAACPRFRPARGGMQRADSWATDAHKWLNTTYDCGRRRRARPCRVEQRDVHARGLPAGGPAAGALGVYPGLLPAGPWRRSVGGARPPRPAGGLRPRRTVVLSGRPDGRAAHRRRWCRGAG